MCAVYVSTCVLTFSCVCVQKSPIGRTTAVSRADTPATTLAESGDVANGDESDDDGDGAGDEALCMRPLSSRGDAKYRNARVRSALVLHSVASVNVSLTKTVVVALAEKLGVATTGKAADVRARVDDELARRALSVPVAPTPDAAGEPVTAGKSYGSSVIVVTSDLFHGVTQRVRQSWSAAVDASAWRRWHNVDADFARKLLPPLSDDFLDFLFATPTVSLAPVHSASAARAVNFVDGLSNHSRANVYAYLDAAGRRVLLYNRCAASMSSGTLHHCFFMYTLPNDGRTTWAQFRASYRAACSCKNGETTGNCGHIAALLRRLGQLRGDISRTKTRVARAVATHANSAVLPQAWARVAGEESAQKSRKRHRGAD
jgi:hypothetical protein